VSLAVGTRLGVYDIVGLLGRGGMGEVYHARDARLLRDVAIKVLPPDLADDKARLDRFEREAILLAAVIHPNVAVIHGLEQASGTRFLVMELVAGPTLADRLKRGPLSVAHALNVSRQLVDALDAAHQRRVIHRDLKPANIKVSDDGRVKVLDFGLAKSSTEEPVAESKPQSTVTAIQAGSQAVVVMGTPAYMSPEQARGAAVDRRTDIWAFGCVVYEMLTGSRVFDGETTPEVIAAVFEREPDWSALPSDTPAPVRALLRRCLQKDAARRLRDIGDARLDIEDAEAPSVATPREQGTAPRWARVVIAIGTAVMLAAAFAASRYVRSPTGISDVLQFRMPAPLDAAFPLPPQFAVSPNGRLIAFVAISKGSPALWLRSLDDGDPKPLAGTEGAALPFWSPDSQFVAFFSNSKLKKLKVSGGQPVDLADASLPGGGTWNTDDDIVFAPTPTSGLQRVAASGGTPTPVASKERRGELRQRWPQFLPDGRHFLVNLANEGTWIGSLDSTDWTFLVSAKGNRGDSTSMMTTYAAGYLFSWRDGVVEAQAFDPDARKLKRDPIQVANQIASDGTNRYVALSVSATGVMAYARGNPTSRPTTQLTWKDRMGKVLATVGEPAEHTNLSLSPDERYIAVSIISTLNRDIWLIDRKGSRSSRFTFDPAADAIPIWSPDGGRIVFASLRGKAPGDVESEIWDVYQKPTNGNAKETPLLTSQNSKYPMDWSPDGRFVLYAADSAHTGVDIWALPLFGDRRPFPVVQSPSDDNHGAFAPDGKWIAYSSNESGQDEIYVQPFPATGGNFQVSRRGGTKPAWRGDGKEIFFLSPDGTMMAAAVNTANGFTAGVPESLFASGAPLTTSRRQYAVTKDGQQFLINVALPAPAELTITVNWQQALRR